ncbi:tRNA pseudouridine synthase [Sarcoptes scabiei]|nr:tRNA pseudouridine synthase [Sarcoptes scabiei]
MEIKIEDLLQELIRISKKSAQISRIIRFEMNDMIEMIVQEKTDHSKNPRFLHDYKTFADVLIQSVAIFFLNSKFPGLSSRIFGEESEVFVNRFGEKIVVEIRNNPNYTREILEKILSNNSTIIEALIKIIHNTDNDRCEIAYDSLETSSLLRSLTTKQDNIGIWIDPIDSTSEYIKDCSFTNDDDHNDPLPVKGLGCVTCLFGVFDINTGEPILGVLSQPFYRKNKQSEFTERCFWGLKIGHLRINNFQRNSLEKNSKIILIGNDESDVLREKLIESYYSLIYVPGAGHKLMNVAIGEAAMMITSSKTTYFWDTCAAHAILRSMGGGLIPFENCQNLADDNVDLDNEIDTIQIKYTAQRNTANNEYCMNSRGLIAYRDNETLLKVIRLLK